MNDLPETFWRGLEEFNQREFYACHDTLEALWMDALHPLRLFYQGILQLAVAYYHLGNGNWKGGVILLSTGIRRLEYFAPEYLGIDVESLLDKSSTCLERLQELGQEQIQAFDLQTIPQIQYEKESPSLEV
ncbi:MAG: DUF309 domain-containing protein [Anaerolineae bacterium]|nr:DUF309 domain-containing protein [Gloeobacterales cyanobacterium ES-bin-313]